ncbi:hypothetical protein HY213_00475 [Candidatus Peregrinibacteria bacterium]|nr:hypothetical protein [Candidatus Peregrinibacteria bacterium]
MATEQEEIPRPDRSASPEKILAPKDIARILGRPVAEVESDLKSKDDRDVLISKLENQQEVKEMFGKNVPKLREQVNLLGETLNQKKGFFGKLKEMGGWVWEKTKAVLGNKWVQLGILAVLVYLGYRNWDKIMSIAKEVTGKVFASAKEVGMGAPSTTAAPITETLRNTAGSAGVGPMSGGTVAEKAGKAFYPN